MPPNAGEQRRLFGPVFQAWNLWSPTSQPGPWAPQKAFCCLSELSQSFPFPAHEGHGSHQVPICKELKHLILRHLMMCGRHSAFSEPQRLTHYWPVASSHTILFNPSRTPVREVLLGQFSEVEMGPGSHGSATATECSLH